jgi:hypothetical protein
MVRTGLVSLLVLLAFQRGISLACMAAPQKHEIEQEAAFSDFKAPATPKLEVLKVTRGKGPIVQEGGLVQFSSVDGSGVVQIGVIGLSDDQSAEGEIGLRARCIGGKFPVENLYVPDFDFKPLADDSGQSMFVMWDDGRTDEQEPISFSIEVYSIDRAGNVSALPDTVLVEDPGRNVGE